ncbi:MAG: hypothetical protein ACLFR7_01105 [Opitutales bacterium]
MGNHDYDSGPEGDWEERGDLSWNEFDWQQFLLRQQKEIARFVTLYDENLDRLDRLDRAAAEMGWERDDWAVGEGLDEDDDDILSEVREDSLNDADPYTLHRHPVYVAGAGLFLQLRSLWEIGLGRFPEHFDVQQAWKAANTLSSIERHLILMVQGIDMGDFLLAVCHGKIALRALNEALQLLEPLASRGVDAARLADALRLRLFDLREICLRVMTDCREEDRRGFRDND